MTTIQLNLKSQLNKRLTRKQRKCQEVAQLFGLLERFDLNVLDVNLDDELGSYCRIAEIWSVEDVLMQCPRLKRKQAWNVLRFVQRHHDASVGLNWETIDLAADQLYSDVVEIMDAEP